MPPGRSKNKDKDKDAKPQNGTANLGFEAKLWAAADALRNNMDAAEYKHVVLGLIFLKYISDAFEAKHAELDAQRAQGADPEDPDEYRALNIFWVPPEARWAYLKSMAPQPTIGQLIDDAMSAIERDNVSLKGVLPKDFARPGLDKQRLGQIINLVSDVALGSTADRSKDTLGRVYEYFLSRFASAEGKSGGQFYTPSHVVRVLVEVLAPYKGRVYDPCCGSGGMFVQSEKFIEAHAGKLGDISIYGQESNYTTWRLAKMNLAIRGIDAQIGHGDTFHNNRHPDLKADYVLANPPFNDSDWRGELLKDDKRWGYGVPPAGNANYAWVQHFIHHLAPTGLAGFVLANGSMSSNQSGEGEIRKAIVEADLVDCMVAMPGQLFYSTQIPVCLWFLARSKKNSRFRDRRGETLFIDARKMGTLIDRVRRELSDKDIATIADTYHAWRGDKEAGNYADARGFCMRATLDDIRKHSYVLTPGRYVGAAEVEADDEPFAEKMMRLAATLRLQQDEGAKLDASIAAKISRNLGMEGNSRVTTTFGQLITDGLLEIGDGYRAKNEELGGHGPIFLRAGHVTDTHIDFTGVERFHANLADKVQSKMSKTGDAIVTTKGNSTGRTAFVTASIPQFVYSPHLSYWRSLDEHRLKSGFLRFWSKSAEFTEQLTGMKASTDMAPYLSLVDQRRLEITLPSPDIQDAIAYILGSLDDKIELNRRMNETLEVIAQALFKSWFFSVYPARATAADLANDGILEIGDGYRAKNTELGKPGLPFIRAGDLNKGFDTEGAEFLRESSVAKVGNKSSRPGDVAFTSKGTIGRFARVTEYTDKFVYSPQVCFWRSLDHSKLHPAILYCWMQSEDLKLQIAAVSGQTDMAPYVSLRDQRQMEVPVFPETQHDVARHIGSILERQAMITVESKVLAACRDALLPKLISGELRVKDAEKLVSARDAL